MPTITYSPDKLFFLEAVRRQLAALPELMAIVRNRITVGAMTLEVAMPCVVLSYSNWARRLTHGPTASTVHDLELTVNIYAGTAKRGGGSLVAVQHATMAHDIVTAALQGKATVWDAEVTRYSILCIKHEESWSEYYDDPVRCYNAGSRWDIALTDLGPP